VTLL
jgi:integrase